MGFAPLAYAPTIKAAPVAGELPDCQYTSDCALCYIDDYCDEDGNIVEPDEDESTPTWAKVLAIVIIVLLFVALPAFLIYYFYFRP
jgi:hypothetical protein